MQRPPTRVTIHRATNRQLGRRITAGKLAQLATRGRSSRVIASEAKRELAWMNNEMGAVHLVKMRPLQVPQQYMIVLMLLVECTAATSSATTSTSTC